MKITDKRGRNDEVQNEQGSGDRVDGSNRGESPGSRGDGITQEGRDRGEAPGSGTNTNDNDSPREGGDEVRPAEEEAITAQYDLAVVYICPDCKAPQAIAVPQLVKVALEGHGIKTATHCCQKTILLTPSDDHRQRIGQGPPQMHQLNPVESKNLMNRFQRRAYAAQQRRK